MNYISSLCQQFPPNCCQAQASSEANLSFGASTSEAQMVSSRDRKDKSYLRHGQLKQNQGSIKANISNLIACPKPDPVKMRSDKRTTENKVLQNPPQGESENSPQEELKFQTPAKSNESSKQDVPRQESQLLSESRLAENHKRIYAVCQFKAQSDPQKIPKHNQPLLNPQTVLKPPAHPAPRSNSDHNFPSSNISDQPPSSIVSNHLEPEAPKIQDGFQNPDFFVRDRIQRDQPIQQENLDLESICSQKQSLTPSSSEKGNQQRQVEQGEQEKLLERPRQVAKKDENGQANAPETYQEWQSYLSLMNLQLDIIAHKRGLR